MSNVIELPENYLIINQVKTLAQKNLPIFIYRWTNKNKDEKYSVKCEIREGEIVEHLWVEINNLDEKAEIMTGTIANDPVDLKNLKFGDTVNVEFARIEDLIISRGNRIEGGFFGSIINNQPINKIKDTRPFLVKLGLKK